MTRFADEDEAEDGSAVGTTASTQREPLVEAVPDDLLKRWQRGPLLLATRASMPVVELRGRTLTLRWSRHEITAHVSECQFRVGRPWRMKLNARSARRLFPFGDHDLILIDFPPLRRGFLTGRYHSLYTAPVGYTEASLQVWKRALAPLLREPSGESQSPITQFLET
ncbi:hypothetical protein [Alienimonas californiensis]|uniref:Uncharacterized protein n=1 Tax=Alienimonas californiensis TaxID=2527989 RepID=A0A517P873_9PLAN|nr:hypothetical protein [Alienimonas californiensis]QDT15579.1 hypothetical protein CA12_16640 [Alienimonas californiensis]